MNLRPQDMSPGRSFFVATFGVRAGLGYKCFDRKSLEQLLCLRHRVAATEML